MRLVKLLPVAVTFATVPTATAAELSVPACVNAGSNVPVSGAGWPASTSVRLTVGPTPAQNVLTDAAGAFSAAVPSTSVVFGSRRQDAVSATAGPVSATAAVTVVRPDPGITPGVRRPTIAVRINGIGYPQRAVLYAHLRRSGRTIKTVRLGRTVGPCGAITARVRRLLAVPGRADGYPGASRRYSVRIAAARRLTATTRPTGVIPLTYRHSVVDGANQVVVESTRWLAGGS